jgi:hypothetical protein
VSGHSAVVSNPQQRQTLSILNVPRETSLNYGTVHVGANDSDYSILVVCLSAIQLFLVTLHFKCSPHAALVGEMDEMDERT